MNIEAWVTNKVQHGEEATVSLALLDSDLGSMLFRPTSWFKAIRLMRKSLSAAISCDNTKS